MHRKGKDLGYGNRYIGEWNDKSSYKGHMMRIKKARNSEQLNSFFMNTTTNYFSDKPGEGRHSINVQGTGTFKPNVTRKDNEHNRGKHSLSPVTQKGTVATK